MSELGPTLKKARTYIFGVVNLINIPSDRQRKVSARDLLRFDVDSALSRVTVALTNGDRMDLRVGGNFFSSSFLLRHNF